MSLFILHIIFIVGSTCVQQSNGNGNILKSEFIRSFFASKNYKLTVNVCWKYGEVVEFLKRHDLRQAILYRKFSDGRSFYLYTFTDNYFVLDMDCESSFDLLEHANKTNLFRFPLKHVLLINHYDLEEKLLQRLENYTVFPSSEVTLAVFKNTSVEFSKVYRINKVDYLRWEPFGSWNLKGGLKEDVLLPPAYRRHNMQGRTFSGLAVLQTMDTLNHLEDFKSPKTDVIAKQSYGAFKALIDYCNIDLKLKISDTYGYYNKTSGRWNGLIDDLIQERGVISAFPFLFTKERLLVVDWLKMMSPLDIRFMLRKPPVSYVSSIFSIAFHPHLWYATIALMVLVAFVAYLVLKCERKVHPLNQIDVGDVVVLNLEAVCQQGTLLATEAFSARITIWWTMLSFMLLYVAYSGNVLIILQSTKEILTLKELLDSKIAAGGMNTKYMPHYLAASNDPVRQRLYESKIGPKGYYPLDKGMQKVQEGFFAFHVEIVAGYYYAREKFTEYEMCSLQKLDGYIPRNLGYLPSTKNSPYKKIFITGLHKVHEYGIHKRNVDRLYSPPKCYGDISSFISIGIIDTYEAMMIMCYGTLLSAVVLIAEIFYCNLKKCSQKR